MSKRWLMTAVTAAVLGFAGVNGASAANGHRLGGGVNYWVALDDLNEDVDSEGFGYLASYQYRGGWLGLGLDVEMLPDRFGEDMFAPEAYLIVGKTLYAAAGIGVNYQDGDFAEEPFYGLRAGLDLELLSNLYLDIYANYRFGDKTDFEDEATNIDTDTVFLGAALRIGF